MATLAICVPVPGTNLAKQLVPGSAIVCALELTNKRTFPTVQEVLIYFEGNVYGAESMQSFRHKIVHAAGRMMTRYPTIARQSVSTSELLPVGEYDYEYKIVEIFRPDLVENWEQCTGIYDQSLQDPASLRLTLSVDYELNGELIEDMKMALQQAIQREIGNGALTGETAAEVDRWDLLVE